MKIKNSRKRKIKKVEKVTLEIRKLKLPLRKINLNQ